MDAVVDFMIEVEAQNPQSKEAIDDAYKSGKEKRNNSKVLKKKKKKLLYIFIFYWSNINSVV
jgi:hypothetical protein